MPVDRDPNARPAAPMEKLLYEVKKVIVGQDHLLERMVVALLARGHLLVEGVPGLAKTMAVKTLAQSIGGEFNRIQFTPDLVPSDLVGTRVFRPDKTDFETELGPVFCNFLLADEINRAPAKVQSALLEVMQEHQVTIGHNTFPVPSPFLVLATQNPIESEGTYPLPEAQVDRFMLKVLVDYPAHDEELTVVARSLEPEPELQQVLSLEELQALQAQAADVFVDPALISWTVDVATATRKPREHGLDDVADYIAYGASPRGPISLVAAGRALALIRGRDYVVPADLEALVRDAFRHRLVLSYRALAEEVAPDVILDAVLATMPTPQIDLGRRTQAA
jgi:MoxR-like ATPase